MSDYICVFDCETIPDVEALNGTLNEDDLNEYYEEIPKEKNENLF